MGIFNTAGSQTDARQQLRGSGGQTDAGQASSNQNTDNGLVDHLLGSTDEAIGRATDAAAEGDIAGVGDSLAGSMDEAVGRTTSAVAEGDPAGAADAIAGGLDEGFDNYVVDPSFQRPGELPFVTAEDSVDLWGGSPSNPTGDPNFNGEDRRHALMQYLPEGSGGMILGGIVLLVVVMYVFGPALSTASLAVGD